MAPSMATNWCAVCLLIAAIVTLQGCGDEAEAPTSSLRGEVNSTAVPNATTAGGTTTATAGNKTSASTEDVPNEETKTQPTSAQCWSNCDDKFGLPCLIAATDAPDPLDAILNCRNHKKTCRDSCIAVNVVTRANCLGKYATAVEKAICPRVLEDICPYEALESYKTCKALKGEHGCEKDYWSQVCAQGRFTVLNDDGEQLRRDCLEDARLVESACRQPLPTKNANGDPCEKWCQDHHKGLNKQCRTNGVVAQALCPSYQEHVCPFEARKSFMDCEMQGLPDCSYSVAECDFGGTCMEGGCTSDGAPADR